MKRAAILLAFALGGLSCAGSSSGGNYFTLRTGRSTQQMSLGAGGQIIGPSLALAPTSDGYRGMANSAAVELRSDGKHIQGTMHDQLVDMHLSLTEDGLIVRGTFAGRLGRLEATNVIITSNFGLCTYELEAVGTRYEGKRACGVGSRIPIIRPVAVEFPVGFERLPVDRQAMLLTLMLSQ